MTHVRRVQSGARASIGNRGGHQRETAVERNDHSFPDCSGGPTHRSGSCLGRLVLVSFEAFTLYKCVQNLSSHCHHIRETFQHGAAVFACVPNWHDVALDQP